MRMLATLAGAATVMTATAAVAATAPNAHYDVKAKIDRAAGTITAVAVIDLPADAAPGETRFVLGKRFTVTRADAGAGAATRIVDTDKPFPGLQAVVVRPKAGQPAPRRVTIAWKGPLNGDEKVTPVAPVTAERVELFADSVWMPYRDDLGVFTLDAEIEGLGRDTTVITQGDVSRSGDVTRIRRELADMDFVLVADASLKRVVDGDVEINARDLENPYVKLYRKHAAGSIAYYEEWFGPLPHRPVRLAVVSRSRGPGYARRGYIIVTERGDANAPQERRIATFVAHEFGHAWWSHGGPTTEDYWMTESMASYVANRYAETLGMGYSTEELTAMRELSRKTGPILGGGRPSGEAVYGKGPMLLLDLEHRIGRRAMDRIIAELAPNPPSKTAIFLAKVAEVAGPEAAAAFEADLRRDGYAR